MRSSSGSAPSSPSSPLLPGCLEGRTALVTGGGSGIGLEVARQLARHGCRLVVVGGRRQSFLDSAVRALREEIRRRRREAGLCGSAAAGGRGVFSRQEQRAFGFACDVREPEQCRRLLEFFAARCRDDDEEEEGGPPKGSSPPSPLPGLDVLVNGAAGNFLAAAEHLSPRGFETVMAIDALGTFNVTSAAFPYLRRSSEIAASLEGSRAGDGAVVINISATLQYGATFWQIHASAAKAAVDSMTRSWALEWGHAHGIRVVGIAPGPIAGTPGTAKLAPTAADTGVDADRAPGDPAKDWIRSRIPLGRMGDAAEIGHAVLYLCASQYVTGTVLVVDGGEWLSRHAPLVPREKVAELSRRVEKASRGDDSRGSPPLPPPPQRSKL